MQRVSKWNNSWMKTITIELNINSSSSKYLILENNDIYRYTYQYYSRCMKWNIYSCTMARVYFDTIIIIYVHKSLPAIGVMQKYIDIE